MGVECTKTDAEMTYLKNWNINESIRHKPRKKYVYEIDIQNIYNLSVGQKNEQLQENNTLDATLKAVSTG